jgi:Xaa-Pro dipeptidase
VSTASSRTQLATERIAKARALMRRDGFDSLLLINSTNLLYLSGYPRAELTLARPRYLFVPQRGAPVLLVHGTPQWRTAEWRRPWIEDIRTYSRLSAVPLMELTAILHDLGLEGARIGTELGFEQRIGLPFAEFEQLRREFATASLEDASSLLWELRMIKSTSDLDALRDVCRITAEAYTHTFAPLRSSDTENQVAQRMKTEMVRGGAEDPWVYISSGRSRYGRAEAPDEPFQSGDIVWMDAGCRYRGFWSDYSRAAVIGHPSADQLEAQRLVYEITQECVALVRPGVRVAEIAAHCNSRIDQVGLPAAVQLSRLAGRVGHGIGFDVTEPPHVAEYDSTVLEPGMVIAVEPNVVTDFGKFHIEENVAVTAGEPEVLSSAPWRLQEISA